MSELTFQVATRTTAQPASPAVFLGALRLRPPSAGGSAAVSVISPGSAADAFGPAAFLAFALAGRCSGAPGSGGGTAAPARLREPLVEIGRFDTAATAEDPSDLAALAEDAFEAAALVGAASGAEGTSVDRSSVGEAALLPEGFLAPVILVAALAAALVATGASGDALAAGSGPPSAKSGLAACRPAAAFPAAAFPAAAFPAAAFPAAAFPAAALPAAASWVVAFLVAAFLVAGVPELVVAAPAVPSAGASSGCVEDASDWEGSVCAAALLAEALLAVALAPRAGVVAVAEPAVATPP